MISGLTFTSPMFGLGLSIGAFNASKRVALILPRSVCGGVVGIAILLVILLLELSGILYSSYFVGAQVFNWMLGPATICLAFPLNRHIARLKGEGLTIGVSLLVGSFNAITFSWLIGRLLLADRAIRLTLLAKSVSSAVAIAISEKIGGFGSLTVVTVILTGIFGAAVSIPLLKFLGFRSKAVCGFSVGMSSRAIGTAAMYAEDEELGAYSALGMTLNCVLTGVLIPWLVHFYPLVF